MRVVVTGSRGNIGRPLVRALRDAGHTVLEIDARQGYREGYLTADIRNAADLFPVLDFDPSVIFHLASMVSRVTCEASPALTIDANLHGLQNVIEVAKRTQARLVYFSTSEVYGDIDVTMRETMPCYPNNRYGLTKLLGERLVEYEVDHHGLDAVTLRPFMMYDEDEEAGDHRSAMIRFAHDLARGLPISVHKCSARGWFHVSDAVRAIIAAAEVGGYHVINIGHPDIRPISELAEMIRTRLGAAPELVVEQDQPDQMTLVKNPSLKRQTNLLGVVPYVSLEEGVDRVCASMCRRVADAASG
jgi:nucleoside-diphosphate-sugar epimerase